MPLPGKIDSFTSTADSSLGGWKIDDEKANALLKRLQEAGSSTTMSQVASDDAEAMSDDEEDEDAQVMVILSISICKSVVLAGGTQQWHIRLWCGQKINKTGRKNVDDKVRIPGDVVKAMIHGIRLTGRPGPKCSQPSGSAYMHDKLLTASTVANAQGIYKN
ncbi:hypothetical protein F4678DRAFT_478411 [Xylaria arbuscula]|nr:hypothetical protein F4678DRAFT_478411 [Xylaria arbuscula]